MNSYEKEEVSRNTAKRSVSQVHIEQFFAICYCLTPFRWFMTVYVARFQFFSHDRLTD